jgi:hypothetical protein
MRRSTDFQRRHSRCSIMRVTALCGTQSASSTMLKHRWPGEHCNANGRLGHRRNAFPGIRNNTKEAADPTYTATCFHRPHFRSWASINRPSHSSTALTTYQSIDGACVPRSSPARNNAQPQTPISSAPRSANVPKNRLFIAQMLASCVEDPHFAANSNRPRSTQQSFSPLLVEDRRAQLRLQL